MQAQANGAFFNIVQADWDIPILLDRRAKRIVVGWSWNWGWSAGAGTKRQEHGD